MPEYMREQAALRLDRGLSLVEQPSTFAQSYAGSANLAENETRKRKIPKLSAPGPSSYSGSSAGVASPRTSGEPCVAASKKTSGELLSVLLHDYYLFGPREIDGGAEGSELGLTVHHNHRSKDLGAHSNLTRNVHTTQIFPDNCRLRDAGTQTETPVNTVSAETQTDQRFKAEDILNNDTLLRQYTGIPNANAFKVLFDYLPPVVCKRQTVLDPIDEFLLTLMRLRLALPIFDLAFRFSIPKTSCSSIISAWIDHMHDHLSLMTFWPSRSGISRAMPSHFKTSHPDLRAVIGCTEFQSPAQLQLSRNLLKKNNSKPHIHLKALVGVTPNGVVSFTSDLWAGCISDRHIALKSGLLDLFDEGDCVVTDKNLFISDLTSRRNVKSVILPSRQRVSTRDVDGEDRTCSEFNLRSLLDSHMKRLNKYQLLRRLTSETKATASRIWKVVNHLTTLQPPPLYPCDNS